MPKKRLTAGGCIFRAVDITSFDWAKLEAAAGVTLSVDQRQATADAAHEFIRETAMLDAVSTDAQLKNHAIKTANALERVHACLTWTPGTRVNFAVACEIYREPHPLLNLFRQDLLPNALLLLACRARAFSEELAANIKRGRPSTAELDRRLARALHQDLLPDALMLLAARARAFSEEVEETTERGRRETAGPDRRLARALHGVWSEAGGVGRGAHFNPNTGAPTGAFFGFCSELLTQIGLPRNDAILKHIRQEIPASGKK